MHEAKHPEDSCLVCLTASPAPYLLVLHRQLRVSRAAHARRRDVSVSNELRNTGGLPVRTGGLVGRTIILSLHLRLAIVSFSRSYLSLASAWGSLGRGVLLVNCAR
jgi:hypothetical protein